MTRTVNVSANIPTNRELHIALPQDFPVGPAEIVLRVTTPLAAAAPTPTLGDLAASEFFGVWSGRKDITDSVEFARELRAQSWKR